MKVEGVEPRDVTWEVERPVYRVYFWHEPAAPEGVPQEQVMWRCDEYRLTEVADVEEALDWARQRLRDGQTFVLYAESGQDPDRGLIRLWGADPHTHAEPLRLGET